MIDHVAFRSKDEERPSERERSRDSDSSVENTSGSYYYDDSSNYEVYQDDDDELDDSQANDRSAD